MPFKSVKKAKAYRHMYAATHKKEAKIYRDSIVERIAVRSHHYNIFNPNSWQHENYKGMPFYDAWNTDKGGSYKVAEKWIIDNIGKRPKGSSLHVINHDIGFVPGNLEWAHPQKQSNQVMFRILAQQRNKIKKLEERILEFEDMLCVC